MKKIAMLGIAALVAACGGAQGDAFDRATPSFDTLALDMTEADATPDESAQPASEVQALDAARDEPCHPHLFIRTHAFAAAFNAGVWRILRPIHELIGGFPRHRDGSTHGWERVRNGIDWKYSIVKTGDHSFTATLEVKKVADADFVTVYSATVQRDPANHDGSGNATLDLDKLALVTGDSVSGQLAVRFVATAAEKTVIGDMTNFKVNAELARNGHSVFHKVSGKGGSLKLQDDLSLACTGAVTMVPGLTPVQAVARWLVVSDGIHFRGDAGAVGGQVPAADKWEGVTCAEGRAPRETYWMMKLENLATGQPESAASRQNTVETAAACDPAFGPVPKIDDASADYDFSLVNFASDDPLPFP